MKPITTNQEILLFTGTSFSSREFSKLDKHNDRLETNSSRDELERACWAGILFEMLPELTTYPFASCKMHIWNIHSAEHFLLISQGTDQNPIEDFFSIDPQLFLSRTQLN